MGRIAQPDSVIAARGTGRPDRARVNLVPPLTGEVNRPDGMTPEVSSLFDEQVAIMSRRGQQVIGLERVIAQYCSIWIDVESRGARATAADRNTLLQWHRQFLNTPVAQVVSAKRLDQDNPFRKHARRPKQ